MILNLKTERNYNKRRKEFWFLTHCKPFKIDLQNDNYLQDLFTTGTRICSLICYGTDDWKLIEKSYDLLWVLTSFLFISILFKSFFFFMLFFGFVLFFLVAMICLNSFLVFVFYTFSSCFLLLFFSIVKYNFHFEP